jgi:hypothetical protein
LALFKKLDLDKFETNETTIGSLVVFCVDVELNESELNLVCEFMDNV